jgi:hypothetical protein
VNSRVNPRPSFDFLMYISIFKSEPPEKHRNLESSFDHKQIPEQIPVGLRKIKRRKSDHHHSEQPCHCVFGMVIATALVQLLLLLHIANTTYLRHSKKNIIILSYKYILTGQIGPNYNRYIKVYIRWPCKSLDLTMHNNDSKH